MAGQMSGFAMLDLQLVGIMPSISLIYDMSLAMPRTVSRSTSIFQKNADMLTTIAFFE